MLPRPPGSTRTATLFPYTTLVRSHVRETVDFGLVAGFSMPLPIFNRNQGNVAAAQSGIEAANARLTAQRNESRTQIANARSDLASAEARLQALEGSGLGEAREALRTAGISYCAGKASLLELLAAQQANALTPSELIDARRARAEDRKSTRLNSSH